jgi:hypothetical protein
MEFALNLDEDDIDDPFDDDDDGKNHAYKEKSYNFPDKIFFPSQQMTMRMTPLLPETKLQEPTKLPQEETMMVSQGFLSFESWKSSIVFASTDDDDDDYDIESFFDGILGDDDGKKTSSLTFLELSLKRKFSTDDDDDDDEEETPAQTIQQQPIQQAVQQPSSPVSSDAEAQLIGEEAVADNIDDISGATADGVESGAKDPQQAALDQAATVNNSIDPVSNEAIVDDEGETLRTTKNPQILT